MSTWAIAVRALAAELLVFIAISQTGCGKKASGVVDIAYEPAVTHSGVIQNGMTLTVSDVVVTGACRDPSMWSRMARDRLRQQLGESAARQGVQLVFRDDESVRLNQDEKDRIEAGLQQDNGASRIKILAPDARISARINLTERLDTSNRRTFGPGVARYAPYAGGYLSGYPGLETRQEVHRYISGHCYFSLSSVANSWQPVVHESTFVEHETARPSLFMGNDRTEADLGSSDEVVIRDMIDREVRLFVAKLFPCRVSEHIAIQSSRNLHCTEGVKKLNDGRFQESLPDFVAALQEDDKDHRAHFGYGLALEKLGRTEEARLQYERARSLADDKKPYSREYAAAVQRIRLLQGNWDMTASR